LVDHWPGSAPKGNNNVRLSRGYKLLNRPDLHPSWRKLIERHQSQAFFDLVNQNFGLKLSGTVAPRGTRGDIGMECQVADTSQVAKASSSKGPHWDSPRTKWAGILYCRHPDDHAGGNLQLYDVPSPRFYKDRFTRNHGEPFLTIPYEANVFVCWVNTPLAIHGVSVRQPTEFSRRFINFTVDS